MYIDLPTFSQPGYTGRYELSYTSELGVADDFPDDNTYGTSMSFDSLLSYVPENADGVLDNLVFFKPTTATQQFQICSFFKDPNAHLLNAEGVYAGIAVNAPEVVVGQQLTAQVFEWNDDFTGLSNAFFEDIVEVMNGEYVYTDSLLEETAVYIPFFETMPLVDNQKYLFCVTTYDMDVFLGHSNKLNYDETVDTTDAITTLLNIDGTWSLGWTTGEVPAIGVRMISSAVGIQENAQVELTPYPNPASTSISIPMKGQSGKASIEIYDSKGAKVASKQAVVGGNSLLSMNLKGLSDGLYTFHVTFERGATSVFRVAVNK